MKKACLYVFALTLLVLPAHASTAFSPQDSPPPPLFFEPGGENLQSGCYLMRICPHWNPNETERVSCTGSWQCAWDDTWVECDYQRYYCRCCNSDCTVLCPSDF